MVTFFIIVITGLCWALAYQGYQHGKEPGEAERRQREASDKAWAKVARAMERATRK